MARAIRMSLQSIRLTGSRATIPLLLVSCLFAAAAQAADRPDPWSYDKFILRVEGGSVTSVEFVSYGELRGTYTWEGTTRSFTTSRGSLDEDPLLLRVLEANNVPTEIVNGQEEIAFYGMGFFMLVLFVLIPVATLLCVIVLLFQVSGLKRPGGTVNE